MSTGCNTFIRHIVLPLTLTIEVPPNTSTRSNLKCLRGQRPFFMRSSMSFLCNLEVARACLAMCFILFC